MPLFNRKGMGPGERLMILERRASMIRNASTRHKRMSQVRAAIMRQERVTVLKGYNGKRGKPRVGYHMAHI
jgi:hypothetical protein